MDIAIIGSGISGLMAGYLLSREHKITVFEQNDYIGGHTATKAVSVGNENFSIDTGFIVFNDATYPNFIRLLKELEIPAKATDMGFSVTTPDDSLEYCGSSIGTLFCNQKNYFNPRFLGMVQDIVRFNRLAKTDISQDNIPSDLLLTDYLARHQFGRYFINGYIVPMASAIWSSSTKTIHNFNARFILQFFENHGLLNLQDRPQWRVLRDGSNSYVGALTDSFKDNIFLNARVRGVVREKGRTKILTDSGANTFDQVIFACHSNEALEMLQDASDHERSVLQSIPYHASSVTLHTDTSLLPKRRKAWASWNYFLKNSISSKVEQEPVLTYNMNILQSIKSDTTFCVTVNGEDRINPEKILGRYQYSHPQFSNASVVAQKSWNEINGANQTWFCGAYWGNGFHEDGVNSAIRVAKGFGMSW